MHPKVLVVSTVDIMPWVLLRNYLRGLGNFGYEVHIACHMGEYRKYLDAEGWTTYDVPLVRSWNVLRQVLPAIRLLGIMRAGRFSAVNTHSPVGNAVGRVSAWLARVPKIICTVHGFYFHERSSRLLRCALIALERILGRITDFFLFVSDEDREIALAENIVRDPDRSLTFYNGVEASNFAPRYAVLDAARARKLQLGIGEDQRVVGIVGRIVKEKGFREFMKMAESVVRSGRTDVTFLVVGDSLATDRDQFGPRFRASVREHGLEQFFRFTGFVNNVSEFLQVMDIFVLPTYREGFPQSVLEAMSCGLPVITTRVRGCREAVVNGVTGILVPAGDASKLAEGVVQLLDNPTTAEQMGVAGRQRVLERYTHEAATERFLTPFRRLRRDLANTGAVVRT